MKILVINAGSSSLKYQLFDMVQSCVLCKGLAERIGGENGSLIHTLYPDTPRESVVRMDIDLPGHGEAVDHVAGLILAPGTGLVSNPGDLSAIGHRVAHGGETFTRSCVVDDAVLSCIRELIPLAPLHNPANLAGIEAAMDRFPGVPSVAVFDTQFGQDLPPRAFRYALPESWYTGHRVRRYGFHGISHAYVSRQLARLMDRPPNGFHHIVCHLGNGSSMTAVRDGRCMDTSMGMTPLAGLIMGTRCGDIDPALHQYMADQTRTGSEEIHAALNRSSGLSGVCGHSDLRDIHAAVLRGDKKAALALDMLCYSIKKYIGAYYAVLGGRLDAIAFTAGIGENDPVVRAGSLEGLDPMGIILDPAANQAAARGPREICTADSPVRVWVIPTNEELEIATACLALIPPRKQLIKKESGPFDPATGGIQSPGFPVDESTGSGQKNSLPGRNHRLDMRPYPGQWKIPYQRRHDMKILNIYASVNGQTEKVAQEIESTCKLENQDIVTINVAENPGIQDLLSADLIFIGSGVYTWLPSKAMMKWIKNQLDHCRTSGLILPGSPRIPGRFACVYTTFAGPHTGEAEALPAIKYMGQLFDHLGIAICDEWALPSAFVPQNMQEFNTNGRLGNIEGRPNKNDLASVSEKVKGLISSMRPG